MSKALAKKEAEQLAKYGDLMDTTEVSKTDIIIPKLLLMQGLSKFVVEERARTGEIRSSLDCKKITEKEGSVEIIPFKVYKTWVTLKTKGNKFVSQEPITLDNAAKPREEIIDGEECKNFETINYYCLLPSEIAEGAFMPYVVSFRSTGYTAGKTLESIRIKMMEFGQPLCFKTFNLEVQPRMKDDHSYFAYTITEARKTEDNELDAVKYWKSIVDEGDVRTDESEFDSSDDVEKDVTPRGKVNEGDEY